MLTVSTPRAATQTTESHTTMQYAVKYQLANHHTGRTYDTLKEALIDLGKCQRDATAGLGDQQGIDIVMTAPDGSWRYPTEEEMDAIAETAQDLGIEC